QLSAPVAAWHSGSQALKGFDDMKRFRPALLPLLFLSLNASAAMRSSGGDFAASGSIASPGSSTAVVTNPAGLVANRNVRLSLQAGSPDPMEDPRYRGLLLAGNGTFGAAAGVDYSMPDPGEDRG